MDSARQAGHIEISKLLLKSYDGTKSIDIKALVPTIVISESVNMSSVQGHIVVIDSFDIVTSFPIKGEELLEIEYEDYFGNKRDETYCVYALNDIKRVSDNMQNLISYSLHFVSPGKFLSDQNRIEQAFNSTLSGSGLVSTFVQTLYDRYFKNEFNDKPINIQQTDGEVSIVIPSLTPEQAMHFFARRAFSNEVSTQSFRFFENRDQYFFMTDEKLLQQYTGGVSIDPALANAVGLQRTPIPIFTSTWVANVGPENQYNLMYQLIDFDIGGTSNNNINNLINGRYLRKTIELDVLNGTVFESDYNFFDENSNLVSNDRNFIEQHMNKQQRSFVIKDYSTADNNGYGLRTDTHYGSLYNNKISYFANYENNKVTATIHGRNDIVAGGYLDIQILSPSVERSVDIDPVSSGRYIIDTVDSVIDQGIFKQNLVIIKKDSL